MGLSMYPPLQVQLDFDPVANSQLTFAQEWLSQAHKGRSIPMPKQHTAARLDGICGISAEA
jgi:hypothetical protein